MSIGDPSKSHNGGSGSLYKNNLELSGVSMTYSLSKCHVTLNIHFLHLSN